AWPDHVWISWRDKSTSPAPQSNNPAAMVGFSGVDPGTMHFSVSLPSHQPISATLPKTPTKTPAIRTNARLLVLDSIPLAFTMRFPLQDLHRAKPSALVRDR